MFQTERHALQPHHTAEEALQLLAAGVVAARTEETVTEKDFLVVLHEITGRVDGLHHLLDLLFVDVTFFTRKDVVTREQLVGNVVERRVMMGHGVDLLVEARPSLHVVQHLVHIPAELCHHWQQFVFLHFAQHAVNIQMVQLQIEVGSHETGEIAVVVLFVHVEQLRVV